MRRPPLKIQLLSPKLPPHAFVVILDGDVQNPEFVAYHMEGGNDRCWDHNLAKWKRTVLPSLRRSNCEFWQKHGKEWTVWKP